MLGRPLKTLTRWRVIKDLRSVRTLCITSWIVWVITAGAVWWTSNYEGYSFQISVVEVVLPLVFALWVGFVGIFVLGSALYSWLKTAPAPPSRRRGLIWLVAMNLIMVVCLWPPRSVVYTLRAWSGLLSQERDTPLKRQELSVLSWNLQRMGELARRQKADVKREKAQCIVDTIRGVEQERSKSMDVFAFQETSNQDLKKLEKLLSLSCQFVSYHPTRQTNTGGLGICVRVNSEWRLNYVRKISLQGSGRWRALFAEIHTQSSPHLTFNLINVHFLPHKIAPQDLSGALLSPRDALDLLRDIQETSTTQRAQARGLLDLIKDYKDPTLLMGDFNAPPKAGAHSLLKVAWTDVWQRVGSTSGATRYFGGVIPLRVDYIYALSGTFHPLNSSVGDLSHPDCSDHLPLSAELKL